MKKIIVGIFILLSTMVFSNGKVVDVERAIYENNSKIRNTLVTSSYVNGKKEIFMNYFNEDKDFRVQIPEVFLNGYVENSSNGIKVRSNSPYFNFLAYASPSIDINNYRVKSLKDSYTRNYNDYKSKYSIGYSKLGSDWYVITFRDGNINTYIKVIYYEAVGIDQPQYLHLIFTWDNRDKDSEQRILYMLDNVETALLID